VNFWNEWLLAYARAIFFPWVYHTEQEPVDLEEVTLPDLPAPPQEILRNAAKCLLCGDEVESSYRHDFRSCSCQALSVDGGRTYIRRVGNMAHIKELSEFA